MDDNKTEVKVHNGLAAEQVRHLEQQIKATRELIETKLDAAVLQLNQAMQAREELRAEQMAVCTDRLSEVETQATENKQKGEDLDKRVGKVEQVGKILAALLTPVALQAVVGLGQRLWEIIQAGPAGG